MPPETEWRKRKASRRGAEEEEEDDDDSGEEMKALRERQREELSKVASGGPCPPPCVVLGFLPTWRLEGSEEFRLLTAEVERRLGKKLTTPDLCLLLGLYDHVGLPPDVIYLLVCHCAQRLADRYGPLQGGMSCPYCHPGLYQNGSGWQVYRRSEAHQEG